MEPKGDFLWKIILPKSYIGPQWRASFSGDSQRAEVLNYSRRILGTVGKFSGRFHGYFVIFPLFLFFWPRKWENIECFPPKNTFDQIETGSTYLRINTLIQNAGCSEGVLRVFWPVLSVRKCREAGPKMTRLNSGEIRKQTPHPWDTHYQFSINTLLSNEKKKENLKIGKSKTTTMHWSVTHPWRGGPWKRFRGGFARFGCGKMPKRQPANELWKIKIGENSDVRPLHLPRGRSAQSQSNM